MGERRGDIGRGLRQLAGDSLRGTERLLDAGGRGPLDRRAAEEVADLRRCRWTTSTLPTIATPSAPPTWRVVSFTAEPTPAFAERQRAHDRLGRGRHGEPHATGHQHHAQDDVGPVVAVDGEGRERHQPGGRKDQPARDDELRAEAIARASSSTARRSSSPRPTGGTGYRSRAASSRARTGSTA